MQSNFGLKRNSVKNSLLLTFISVHFSVYSQILTF